MSRLGQGRSCLHYHTHFVLCLLAVACGENRAQDSFRGGTSGCSDLYAGDTLPVFELEFEPQILQNLEADCASNTKEYRPVTFKFASEVVPAMVRLKGNWSWRCEKKQFVISFNETDAKGRFHGLRKIVLDAAWYDPTLLAERLGASYLARLGVASSCVNNARLYINGDYYGVYANVERLDKEYLQRWFQGSEADGNLYDGGEELRTNEEEGDVSRRDTLLASVESLDAIASMVDLQQALRVWAGLAMLPDVDSYWAGVEINYYLYDHPTRGFMWFPYDMDMTAPTGVFDPDTSSVDVRLVPQSVEADPLTYENADWRKEALFKTVLSNEQWCLQFLEYLNDALDAYDVEQMRNDLGRWGEQIASSVAEDPNKPFTTANHDAALATMGQFLPARRQFVEQWLQDPHCPVRAW